MKVLILEDDERVGGVISACLEKWQQEATLVGNGQEAWRKLSNMEYDCILLDLKMPGMGGPELYHLIQEISESVASKVVFITGDTVSPDTHEFISQTENPVVTKPFRMEELLRTVQTLWERQPLFDTKSS